MLSNGQHAIIAALSEPFDLHRYDGNSIVERYTVSTFLMWARYVGDDIANNIVTFPFTCNVYDIHDNVEFLDVYDVKQICISITCDIFAEKNDAYFWSRPYLKPNKFRIGIRYLFERLHLCQAKSANMQLKQFFIHSFEYEGFEHPIKCRKIKDCVLSSGEHAIVVALSEPFELMHKEDDSFVKRYKTSTFLLWSRYVGKDINNIREFPLCCNAYGIPANIECQDIYNIQQISISTVCDVYERKIDIYHYSQMLNKMRLSSSHATSIQLTHFFIRFLNLNVQNTQIECTKIADCKMSNGQHAIIAVLSEPFETNNNECSSMVRDHIVTSILLWSRHAKDDINKIEKFPFYCNAYCIPVNSEFQDIYDVCQIRKYIKACEIYIDRKDLSTSEK
ncbi:MAG: hypothetical protein MJ010_00470 [Paludibacteraceae bacterium]|nr:hypothetical protein [Paludibacteraceae bacterium]